MTDEPSKPESEGEEAAEETTPAEPRAEEQPAEKTAGELIRDEGLPDHDDHHVPGTVALTFIFLLCFAIYFFANWMALADVWHVR